MFCLRYIMEKMPYILFFLINFLFLIAFLVNEMYKNIKRNILLKKSGKRISEGNLNENIKKKFISVFVIIIIYFWAYYITQEQNILVPFSTLVTFIILYINMDLYKNLNGIYENGIIYNRFYSWNNIISYFYFNKDKITIFIYSKMNICDFEMNITEKDAKEIEELFYKNNIKYKNAMDFA